MSSDKFNIESVKKYHQKNIGLIDEDKCKKFGIISNNVKNENGDSIIVSLNSGGKINLINNTSNTGNPLNPAVMSIIGFSNSANVTYGNSIDLNNIAGGNLLTFLAPTNLILKQISVQFQFQGSQSFGLDLNGSNITGYLYVTLYKNSNAQNNIFDMTSSSNSISVGNNVTAFQNFTLNSTTSLSLNQGDRLILVIGNGLSSSNVVTQFSGTAIASLYF